MATRSVDQALAPAKLKPQDIHQVVRVGGSTRIPRVQEFLAEKFGRAKISKDVNPAAVVAVGAAIQAAILEIHVVQGEGKMAAHNRFWGWCFPASLSLPGACPRWRRDLSHRSGTVRGGVGDPRRGSGRRTPDLPGVAGVAGGPPDDLHGIGEIQSHPFFA